MNFDPALAAREALRRACEDGELGPHAAAVDAADNAFSENFGEAAAAAYQSLLEIGTQLPDARAYQAFLIYLTWQQIMDETIPAHFKTGLRLCARYLASGDPEENARDHSQICALRESFRRGLGLDARDEQQTEFERDTFAGGD